MNMSNSGSESSPSRQKRSTERSRETIREYVKLLRKKKVTDSPTRQRNPRSPSEGRSPTVPVQQDIDNVHDNLLTNDGSLLANSEGSLQAPGEESSLPDKSPKAKRALNIVYTPSANTKKLARSSGLRMENLRNAKAANVETNDARDVSEKEKSARTPDAKDTTQRTDKSGGKAKGTGSGENKDQGMILAEGFCGFDEGETSIQTRNKESAKNSAAATSKKPNAKLEKADGKSDSPPDLVLFLKEGRGRAQNYSEPPRLDPESIATRRRTRVPEDPVALISTRTKSAGVEKAKKDHKEVMKKDVKRERRNKVMDTPESLKRLAQGYPIREATKSQSTGKDSPDNASDAKTTKRPAAKSTQDGDSRVRASGTSMLPIEEQEGRSNNKNKGKKNTADDMELQINADVIKISQSSRSVQGRQTSYSNLGTILNQMCKNNAEKRIPVVIMSNSEKETRVMPAKPRSKKKSVPDPSTAVLKIAAPTTPSSQRTKLDVKEDSPPTRPEGKGESKKALKQEANKCEAKVTKSCGTNTEANQNVIVVNITNDSLVEGKDTVKAKDKTGQGSSEDGSGSSKKSPRKQNIFFPFTCKDRTKYNDMITNLPEKKEACPDELTTKSSVVSFVQGSSVSPHKPDVVPSPLRPGSVTSPKPGSVTLPKESTSATSTGKSVSLALPHKSGTVTPPLKIGSLISSIQSRTVTSSFQLGPVTSQLKFGPATSSTVPGSVTSPRKPTLVTSPVKPSLVASPQKSSSVISPIKAGSTSSTPKSGFVTPSLKSGPVTPLIKSSSVTSSINSSSLTPLIKSSSVTSSIKPSSGISPTKPSSGTSSIQTQTTPFVVSMSKFFSIRGAKETVKTTSLTPKMGLKVPVVRGTTAAEIMKKASTPRQEVIVGKSELDSSATKADASLAMDKSNAPLVSTSQGSDSFSLKDSLLDYTDIETEEVVLGETEDSSGQADGVGELPAETDLLAHEEFESSSEEDTLKTTEQAPALKKESLSPEGRVALDHSYSSGGGEGTKGFSSARKKPPGTYDKSMTPRPVYSNASPTKRSLDIMLHNDKINILRQMSQIFNDEKPARPDTDNTISSSDGEEEEGSVDPGNLASTKMKKTEKEVTRIMGNLKVSRCNSSEAVKKISSSKQISNVNDDIDVNDDFITELLPGKSSVSSDEALKTPGGSMKAADAVEALGNMSPSRSQECKLRNESTPPTQKESPAGNNAEGSPSLSSDSPFLGFPDPDPKVHHVPAYSLTLNEKILVQSMEGPAGEVIDIVDGFSFISFSSENEMMSYAGGGSGSRAHRQWLKKKRKKRKRLMREKYLQPLDISEGQPAPHGDEDASTSLRDKTLTTNSGAFASLDLDTFLDENSQLNISYPIPKCKVTEEGVTRMDEDEVVEHSTPPAVQAMTPCEAIPEQAQAEQGLVESNNSQQNVATDNVPDPVHQYEEVNAIDILYPKEKYKYYYNKELCKETKADGSNVFVRRAGKLVPLTTVLKSQKCPLPADSNGKKSVELVYIYDGGKLLTLGGSLTKINPSNSDSVRARVILPIGVPPITKGETVATKIKKVQAVEINEDMAKFALSALQSPHSKVGKSVDDNDKCDKETDCLLVPGPSSNAEKNEETKAVIEVPVQKTETETPPKKVPMKPTKTNILDIIAAKLAMSDEESDGKDEVDSNPPDNCLKEVSEIKSTDINVDNLSSDSQKEESKTALSERNMDNDIKILDTGTAQESKASISEESKLSLKQVDMKEVKPEDQTLDDLRVTKHEKQLNKKEILDSNTEVKQEELQVDAKCREAITVKGDVKEEIDQGRSIKDYEILSSEGGEQQKEHTVLNEKNQENEVVIIRGNRKTSEPIMPTGKEEKKELSKMEEKFDDCGVVLAMEKSEESEPIKVEESEKESEPMILEKDGGNEPVTLKEEATEREPVIQKESDERSDPATSESTEESGESTSSEQKIDSLQNKKGKSTEALAMLETSKIAEETFSPRAAVGKLFGDEERETPKDTPSLPPLEHREKFVQEMKGHQPSTNDLTKMDLKSRVFKKNMYRFPSLSREMKRLNMNFVNYIQQEVVPEEEEEAQSEKKGDCDNEHCRLGCVCDSLLCQRKNVEHCGRIECMFECTCRDESWKHSVSTSGRTMNAVSIFNLDREQKEGLALREKDFKRTVIQTGSEVILVGAERKKRERRLPGRYRETTVWTAPELPPESCSFFDPPDLPLQPDFPGIPLSEASKYIKKFKLNVPWYDIKGISIWCMDHSCYDCRCLSDPTFNDPVKFESPRKSTVLRVREGEESPVKSTEDPLSRAQSALSDFEEALRQKTNSNDGMSVEDSPPEKKIVVKKANCSVMNIVVNNAETRRKYTWKLKEWYHCQKVFCARTAGYTRNRVTEETKNMTISGLAARDTTPEQIVESVVRSLRQQPQADKLKLPSLSCGSNFEPFMGDSLANLQNAIGFTPENTRKPSSVSSSFPLVDLTAPSTSEDVGSCHIPTTPVKQIKVQPQETVTSDSKDSKEATKRRLSESLEPPTKRANTALTLEDGMSQPSRVSVLKKGSTEVPKGNSLAPARPAQQAGESPPIALQKLPRKTLSLLEMMIAEENRGELELDLSNTVPGNALLVAEARFRKLINMSIIGVIGINKAGRCIIGTVDSREALQVMHQIQSMISNNTLDVGPNMREIFFPPPHVGARPRYVMIRCDSHCKWEIVGVVQKKGPIKCASKASDFRTKASTAMKVTPYVPQVIDLEEEERQKQLAERPNSLLQDAEPIAGVEPASPEEKDSGMWEGSLPLIASVHSASDSNMAELIGSAEIESQEPPVTESLSGSTSSVKSPGVQKTIPDLVPISTGSVDTVSQEQDKENSLTLRPVPTSLAGNESQPQQHLYFVPTTFSVSTVSTSTVSNVATAPMKSVKINIASNKIFGDHPENIPSARVSPSGKISYILPKLPPGPGKIEPSVFSPKQGENFKMTVPKPGEGSSTDVSPTVGTSAIPTSKMLYIPVTSGCVSKVLFVPTVSSVSSPRMMLLPTLPSSTSADSSNKMKMVLMPSPQDPNKMILIPTAPDTSECIAAGPTLGGAPLESDKKKMLVLPSSVINNFISRTPPAAEPGSSPTFSQPYQQSCSGTLLVPINNTGALPPAPSYSENNKSADSVPQKICDDSQSQDSLDDVVVIGPSTNSLTITRMRTSESSLVQEETPSLFISSAPTVSRSGSAETNVVSSVTTISSTLIEKSSTSPSESKNKITSENLSQGQQSIDASGLNSLLSKTHKDMISEKDPKTVDSSKPEMGTQSSICEVKNEIKLTEPEQTQGKPQDCEDEKSAEIRELQNKQVQIKKGGYHWSAVDLSLNFKSVKLEWLLGTIRKNVLMNIYRMSQKTHSPVTLSVKNGSSTSMLYGFARICGTNPMPVLILGSVVSAVLSSASVSDSMLFQINSIKYFIRESTGELSSYTYASEHHLVKLASKKRGNGGEMIGIGEKIEIDKMRDPSYMKSENTDKETERERTPTSLSGPSRQSKDGCSCPEAGDFMCMGHSSPAFSSQLSVGTTAQIGHTVDSTNKAIPSADTPHACNYEKLQLPTEEEIPIGLKLATTGKRSEVKHQSRSSNVSKDLSNPEETLGPLDNEELDAIAHEGGIQKCPTNPFHSVPKSNRSVTSQQSGSEHNSVPEQSSSDAPSLTEADSDTLKGNHELPEDEMADVDILGECDSSQEILSLLRKQLESETVQVQKLMMSPFTSPGDHGKRKAPQSAKGSTQGAKRRKTELAQPGFERPCPRSKKSYKAHETKKATQPKVANIGGEESLEAGDPFSKCPTHLAHLRPSSAGDINLCKEEEDPELCGIKILSKANINQLYGKHTQVINPVGRIKQKEKLNIDGEPQNEERNTEVHNKLERMRRRVMRHLFVHLQRVIVKIPKNPLVGDSICHPKKTVLNAGQIVCDLLKSNEIQLILAEEKVRKERSILIKQLAAVIADSKEETRMKWRQWVRDNMQNPTAKQTFEKTWQPYSMEKDILKNALEEANFDMDFDDGSPLPGPSSPQGMIEKPRLPRGRPKIMKRKAKKVGRPHKIVVSTSNQGVSIPPEAAATIPTSILLMAGTSSRGRKIVRKEDTNFVTS